MARTTMRSSKGKKLYAKRDKKGQFSDIQTLQAGPRPGRQAQGQSRAEEADLSLAAPKGVQLNVGPGGISLEKK